MLGLQITLFSLDQFKNSSTKRLDGSELLLTGAMIMESSAYSRYQPGLKKANFRFRNVQIKPFKSFLLKKIHKKILFQCKVIGR